MIGHHQGSLSLTGSLTRASSQQMLTTTKSKSMMLAMKMCSGIILADVVLKVARRRGRYHNALEAAAPSLDALKLIVILAAAFAAAGVYDSAQLPLVLISHCKIPTPIAPLRHYYA